MSHFRKNEKPTVGFPARFFLDGFDRRLSLKRNGLRLEKSQKTEKARKNGLNIFADAAVFPRNRADVAGSHPPQIQWNLL